MRATVNGVTVEGTPEEIAAFVKAHEARGSLGERIAKDPPVRLGPREPPRETEATRKMVEAFERSQRAADLELIIRNALAEIPNVNITPHGRICTGGMRFC